MGRRDLSDHGDQPKEGGFSSKICPTAESTRNPQFMKTNQKKKQLVATSINFSKNWCFFFGRSLQKRTVPDVYFLGGCLFFEREKLVATPARKTFPPISLEVGGLQRSFAC